MGARLVLSGHSAGATTFLGLTDTPNMYISNKTVIVNSTGNGLIFGDPSGLPMGAVGDTLRYDGATWINNKQIENTGTNVYIGEPLGGNITAHTLAVFSHDTNDFCGKVGIGTNTVNEGYRCQIKGDMRQTCSHGLYGLIDTLLGQFPVITAQSWMPVIGYDDILFLGGSSNSFISIADPCNVVEISTIPLSMGITHTAIYGNYLYNVNGGLGFVILDISNLYNPIVVKNQGFPGLRHCCCINKGYLYIFRDNRYIDVYSLADPLNPSLVYTYQEIDFEFAVSWAVKKDNCLILASTNFVDMGLIAAYDITNPLNITKTFLRHLPSCDRLLRLHTSDNNRCYFSYTLGGTATYVDTYDILSTTITYLGTYNFPSYMTRCRGLHVHGNHMYIIDSDSIGLVNLQLYDITNPNNFVLIREYLSASAILNNATDLYLKDDILYILQSGSVINDNSVITVTANTLQHFGGFQTNGILKSNAIKSRHLYLSSAVIPNIISDGGCLFVRSTDNKLCFLDYSGVIHQIT
ncbi:MAG: LVIVD repeat-containing protein [Bacillota bacterium]